MAPLALMLTISFVLPESNLSKRAPGAFITSQAENIKPGAQVYSDEFLVPAACWYLGRNDLNLVGKKGELRYGLDFEDSRHRSLSMKDLGELLATPERTNDVVIIFRKIHFDQLKSVQPLGGPLPIPDFLSETRDQAIAGFLR